MGDEALAGLHHSPPPKDILECVGRKVFKVGVCGGVGTDVCVCVCVQNVCDHVRERGYSP